MIKDTAKGHINFTILSCASLIPKTGRGVFASIDIQTKVTVETSPVLIVPCHDVSMLEKTILNHYT